LKIDELDPPLVFNCEAEVETSNMVSAVGIGPEELPVTTLTLADWTRAFAGRDARLKEKKLRYSGPL
jgi:hypothetical protein